MKKYILLALGLLTFFTASNAYAKDQIDTGLFNNNAISGYDTVAYFKEGKPVKGKDSFSTQWKGATWKFSSAENLATFTANPDKYAPQYGGYCAWAAAHETLASGNPKQWHIEDGKLYLNYNKDIKEKWLPRRAELIPVADANFPDLISE